MNKVFGVKQITSYIRRMIKTDSFLGNLSVEGEVFNCKYHNNGHIYFDLKEENAILRCVMFRGDRSGLEFQMQDGQSVVVTGTMDVYEGSGNYQLYAKRIAQSGRGDLYVRLEELRKKLAESGMFDPMYKRPIPYYASRIGIVTARTGAAIRDIEKVARRRNPYVSLILYPAQVQGEGAASSIVAGIKAMQKMDVDVIIVGRGGGSMEDLWAFNEESVARAIFDSGVPVISAVGHERDFTIADEVADKRAATPSEAAELAVLPYDELMERIRDCRMGLKEALYDRIEGARARSELMQLKLEKCKPENILRDRRMQLIQMEEKFSLCMERSLSENRHRMAVDANRLDVLSPLKQMKRGFSYVETAQGKNITSIAQVVPTDRIRIHVVDGVMESEIKEVIPHGPKG